MKTPKLNQNIESILSVTKNVIKNDFVYIFSAVIGMQKDVLRERSNNVFERSSYSPSL